MKFGRLTDLINNVRKLNQDIIFVTIIQGESIERFILDLNIVDQIFEEGIRSDGSVISGSQGNSYQSNTSLINNGKTFNAGGGRSKAKNTGDRYFLLDTGDFFSTFDVVVDDGGFSIEADTVKPDVDMIEEYGTKILGLNDESKSKLAQKILPMVIEEVKRVLLS